MGEGRNSAFTTGFCPSVSAHHTIRIKIGSATAIGSRMLRGRARRRCHTDSRDFSFALSGGSLTFCADGSVGGGALAAGGGSSAAIIGEPSGARRGASSEPVARRMPALFDVQDDLDVGAPILLASRLGLVGGDGILRAVSDGLEALGGNAEVLHQILLHRFGALLRERLVELGRAL